MTTEHAGAERPPLSEEALIRALVRPGGFWRSIRVTELTGSTNADLLAQAAAGAPEGSVLVAEAQTAGRGRLGRAWVSPPAAALMFSVLLRPAGVPAARRGWVPLLAGVAVAAAVQAVAGLDARLKWPNDVLVGDRKLAGILAEQSADAIVVGAGINVSTSRGELPVETATSLVLEGVRRPDRQRLLCGVLAEFERVYLGWAGRAEADGAEADGAEADGAEAGLGAVGRSAGGLVTTGPGDADASGLRAEYRRLCVTLGRQVRVEFPGGQAVRGTALDVDPDGRLVVRTAEGPLAVSAGDIVHLR